MKEFVKQWLLVFALVVLSVFVVSSCISGIWSNTIFLLELFVTTLAICLLQLLTNKIPVRTVFLKYLIHFAMVLSVVLFFGWLREWWVTPSGVWLVVATIIPAFIAAIILDVVTVRRDLDIINKQIQRRRERLRGEHNA